MSALTRELIERWKRQGADDPKLRAAIYEDEWERLCDAAIAGLSARSASMATGEAALLPGLREALKWKPNTPQLENAMTYAWESALKAFITSLEKANAASPPAAQPAVAQEPTDEQWLAAQTAFDDAVPSGLRGFAEWQDRMRAAMRVLGQSSPMEGGPSGWIHITRQTPALKVGQVLVYSPQHRDEMHSVWIADTLGFQDSTWAKRWGITHWMPLPAEPEVSNQLSGNPGQLNEKPGSHGRNLERPE